MPGVQVLFAFLLAVPFQQRFAQVTRVPAGRLLRHAARGRRVASALFIAPTAYHRMMFRGHDKPRLVAMSAAARARRAGRASRVAMNGAILLVTDFIFDGTIVADHDRR